MLNVLFRFTNRIRRKRVHFFVVAVVTIVLLTTLNLPRELNDHLLRLVDLDDESVRSKLHKTLNLLLRGASSVFKTPQLEDSAQQGTIPVLDSNLRGMIEIPAADPPKKGKLIKGIDDELEAEAELEGAGNKASVKLPGRDPLTNPGTRQLPGKNDVKLPVKQPVKQPAALTGALPVKAHPKLSNADSTDKKFFFEHFMNLMISLSSHDLKEEFTRGENCKIGPLPLDSDKDFYSVKDLGACLQLTRPTINKLKQNHLVFVDEIPKKFPKGFYKGDGIVMVGGGKFSVFALLALETMRKRGSKLPVEIFMPPGEEEPEVCKFYGTLNAKCIFLTDILDQTVIDKMQIKGYQFKSLLIITSSFENVLLLDADNNALVNVDYIFTSLPFNITGLVTWPDYWKRTASPIYYEIAGIELGERVRFSYDTITPLEKYSKEGLDLDTDVPLHDRENAVPDGSTESGQLLINKNKQAGTVLLSLYYNFNGPDYYYPLLSQGIAGEGDKDTFLSAAQVLGYPFYQVKRFPSTEGYHRLDSFHGVAMIQGDPVQDYEVFSEIPPEEENFGFNKINKYMKEVDATFLHAHLPKLDPVDLYKSGVMTPDGKHERMYSRLLNFGIDFDFELMAFEFMSEIFCGTKPVNFQYFTKQDSMKDVCLFVEEHRQFLKSTTEQYLT